MITLFLKGGPMMWPLLILSVLAVTVVLERVFFTLRESVRRRPTQVEEMVSSVELGEMQRAITIGNSSSDCIARALSYALSRREQSFNSALLHSAQNELRRFARGLSLLDTAITLAPLMGLLGTVTGMIRSFGMMGTSELGAPIAITGGIAEALIATAFGLAIAIISVIPFNFLNAQLETARVELEDAGTRLELLLQTVENSTASR